VLIEAMACGVPVIGSDSGELPNVIGDAGLLFAEGDAGALREQVRRLWQQPARRAELAAAGRARVLAHFTQQRVATATAAFYHQLVAPEPVAVGL
jgi:glycosyltransferase involved in cell wall biosynthesis